MTSLRLVLGLAAAVVVVAGIILALFLQVARTIPIRNTGAAHPESQTVQLSRGPVRYVAEGLSSGAPPLLLLHGYQGTLADWTDAWSGLRSCAVPRIRVDVPGFGRSVWESRDFSLPTQADRLVEFLDRLEIPRVTLAGASMGGSLAAVIAARYPTRVSQLALFAPSGYPDSLTYDGLFGLLVKPGPLNSAATWATDTWLFRQAFPRTIAAETLTTTASYGEPWAESLRRIHVPTLIAWSTGDQTTRPWAARRVHDAIAGSVLLMLDDATEHSVPNTRPELTAALLCQLASGTTPVQMAKSIAPSLLRAGEAFSHP